MPVLSERPMRRVPLTEVGLMLQRSKESERTVAEETDEPSLQYGPPWLAVWFATEMKLAPVSTTEVDPSADAAAGVARVSTGQLVRPKAFAAEHVEDSTQLEPDGLTHHEQYMLSLWHSLQVVEAEQLCMAVKTRGLGEGFVITRFRIASTDPLAKATELASVTTQAIGGLSISEE